MTTPRSTPRTPLRLQRLAIDAHGVQVTHDFTSPLWLISGANGAGKSTAINAIDLLTTPVRPSDHPAGVRVSATWDAFAASREISEGEHTATCSTLATNAGIRAVEGAIAGALGKASAFRVADFLALTPTKRTALLEQHQVLQLRDAGTVADAHWTAAGLDLSDVPDLLMGHPLPTGTAQARLNAMVTALTIAYNQCNANIREVRGLAAQASQRQAAADLPAGTVSHWQAQVELSQQGIAELEARAKLAEEAGRGRAALDTELASIDRQLAALDGLAAERATLALEQQLAVELQTKAAADLAAADQAATAAAAIATAARATHAQARHEVEVAADALATAKAKREVLAAVDAILAPLRTLTDREGLPPAVLAALDALDALEQVADLPAHQRAWEAAQAHSEGLDSKVHASHRVSVARTSEAARLRAVAASHGTDVATASARLAALDARLAASTDARNTLQDRRSSLLTTVADNTAANANLGPQLALLVAQRDAQRTSLYRLQDAAALRAEAAATTERVEALVQRRDRLFAAHKLARAAQGAYLSAATATLVDRASYITAKVIGYRMDVQLQDGGCIIELGGQPLHHRSRSEQVIGAVALYVAICAQLPGWRCVRIDDAEGIEEPRLVALATVLATLANRNVLDTVMIARVGAPLPFTGPADRLHLERPT